MKLQMERIVRAPLDRTWQTMTNLRDAPERVSGIESVEILTDGPIGVGTRWRETRIMFGKQATEEMTITAFDENRLMSTEAASCGNQYLCSFHFEEVPEGTRVRMEIDARPQTFAAKLMTPIGWLMAPVMKKAIAKDLEDLANHLEGGSGVPAPTA